PAGGGHVAAARTHRKHHRYHRDRCGDSSGLPVLHPGMGRLQRTERGRPLMSIADDLAARTRLGYEALNLSSHLTDNRRAEFGAQRIHVADGVHYRTVPQADHPKYGLPPTSEQALIVSPAGEVFAVWQVTTVLPLQDLPPLPGATREVAA